MNVAHRNVERARAKWGLNQRTSERTLTTFCLVIMSTILFYGSDMWAVNTRMQVLLKSFLNRCARHITRRYICCLDVYLDHPSDGGSSHGSGPQTDHALRLSPSKWFLVALRCPSTDLPTMPHGDPNLTSTSLLLEPQSIGSLQVPLPLLDPDELE